MTGRRLLVRLVLVALSLAVALVAAELVLRRGLSRATAFYVWEPSFERVFHPDPELVPGVRGPARFVTNSIGLRGDELTGEVDYRILAIGGSTTECSFLDQEEAWPQLVQTLLNGRSDREGGTRVWVGNAGASGRHARDHAIQLERLLAQLPDTDCVVLQVGVNDLMLVLAQGAAYDPGYMDRPDAEREIQLRAFRLLPLGVEERLDWWKRTALWRFGAQLRDRFVPSPLAIDGVGRSLERWREHRRAAPRTMDALPDLAAGLGEFRRNIGRCIDQVEAAGARPILVTQPFLWRPDLEPELARLCWMGGTGDYQARPGSAYYSVAALAQGLALYNRALADLAAERGVELVDLVPLLAQDGTVFCDDVHYTEAGARLVAEAVAAQVASRPPFRPGGR